MPIKFVAYLADKVDVARVKVGQLSYFARSILQLNIELLILLSETTLLAVINSYPIQMDF